jgi:hypothetical protein
MYKSGVEWGIIYPYIDVSTVNANGTITNYVPFKLSVFNHNSYADGTNTIAAVNIDTPFISVYNTSNNYFNMSPPLGDYYIFNSNIQNKSNNILYSTVGSVDNNNNTGTIFLDENIKTQSTKTIMIYNDSVFEKPDYIATESYVIFKIIITNITGLPADPEVPAGPSLLNYYNNTKNLNYKFIPAFQNTSMDPANYSLWRINETTSSETTFPLFKKESLDNYICYSPHSINSERYTFDVLRTGTYEQGGLFKITNIRILVHSAFESHIQLSSIGINTNKTSIGNTAGATSPSHSFTHKKYLLSQSKNGVYSPIHMDDEELIIDTDNPDNLLFSFWINSVPPSLENGEQSPFVETRFSHDISQIVLFNMQIDGEYVIENYKHINRNILSGSTAPYSSYEISIYEYLKSITIFELDDGNTANNKIGPNQIGNLSINKVKLDFMRFGNGANDIYKVKRFYLGKGFLKNADISSFSQSTAVNIKKLRIKGGQLTVKKQKNVAGLIYDNFFVEVEDADMHLLPNPTDNVVYIITEPTSQNNLNVYNSNTITY